MNHLLVNASGGLTAAGYAVSVAAGILLFAAAAVLAGKKAAGRKIGTKQLVYCGVSVALAFAASFVKVLTLPWGGSVTLCSMLFIVLAADWYGAGTGILVGLSYGILQFIQEPFVLSFFQVCCDYLLAFAALGTAGFFSGRRRGLVKGYLAAVFARGAFHTLGGYLYWMSYMPESFPRALQSVYPVVYNYSYLLAEAAITVTILSVPAVSRGIGRVKQTALE